MVRYPNDGIGGADQTTAQIVTNTLNAFNDVSQGDTCQVEQIWSADSNSTEVRCVFPGICTEYYKHHLNGWGSKSNPWNASGDAMYGGMEKQYYLEHEH